MKKLVSISLMFVLSLMIACGPGPAPDKDKLLMLRIDHLTKNFEGATEIDLSQNAASTDSLPIDVHYKPPGDFGNITLLYKPSGDTVFDGSIIWMGKGQINKPDSFDPASQFVTASSPHPLPDTLNYQVIFPQPSHSIPYDSIWYAVDDLKIVKEYARFNKKIGLFFYTPSVGSGNPADWDWIVIMSK
ncbi:MAG: hypothetical protein ACOC31_00865 [Bacteroidota bacterium]